MTSSSPEREAGPQARRLALPDLKVGGWTRLGSDGVVGDAVTEQVLSGLAARASEAARAQGYAAGWAEGRRDAAVHARQEAAEAEAVRRVEDDRRAEEHLRSVERLVAGVAEHAAAAAAAVALVEDRAVEVALAVAEAVIDAELRVVDDAARSAVRRALRLVPAGEQVRVRLHPDAAAALTACTDPGVTVVADPGVAHGDAIAENDDLVVDASISAALDRVREALR